MKRFLTQTLAYLLIAALFNSHIVGVASAGGNKELESTSGHLTLRLPSPAGEDCERSANPLLLQFSSPDVQSALQAFVTQGGELPHVGYVQDDWQDTNRGTKTRWSQRGLAAVGAGLAAVGISELWIFSNPIQSLLNIPDGVAIPPVPPILWATGVPAGVLITPDAYEIIHQDIKKIARYASRRGTQEEEKILDFSLASLVRAGAVLAGMGALGAKAFFAYIEVNLPPIPVPFAVMASVAGVGYFWMKLSRDYTVVGSGYDDLHYTARALTPHKQTLQDHFAAGLRGIRKEKADAITLYQDVQQLRSLVKTALDAFDHDRADLATQDQKTEADKRRSAFLAVAALLELKLIFDVGNRYEKDLRYQSPPAVKADPSSHFGKFKRFVFGGEHPWYDNLTKAATMAIMAPPVLLAAGFSWDFVMGSALPEPAVAPLAAGLALPFGAYLVNKTGNKARSIVRHFTGYHPIEGEREVKPHAAKYINRGTLRGVLEILDWGRLTYLNLPVSMIAGAGMGAVGVSWNLQLPMLIPYFIAMGTDISSIQDWVTRAELRGPRKEQQWVAREYERAAEWVRGISDERAGTVLALIQKDPKDWFTLEGGGGGAPDGRKTPPLPASTSASLYVKGGTYVPPELVVDEEEASGGSTHGSPPRPTVPVSRDGTPPPASLTHSDSSGSEKSSPEKDAKTLHQPRGSQEGFQLAEIDSSARRPSPPPPSSARSSTSSTGSKKGQGPLSIPLLQGEPPTE